ncbi:MAG: VCBS repeat-containing protein [Sumerlaeia bacterium]
MGFQNRFPSSRSKAVSPVAASLLAAVLAAAPADTGTTPQHSVAADFNGDGRADIATANFFDDTVAIHLQDGAGNFNLAQSIPVGLNTNPLTDSDGPRFLALEDYNRDGAPDLTVLCSGNVAFGSRPSLQTLINLGDGTFAPLPAAATSAPGSDARPVQFALGHMDGDHYLDAVIANLDVAEIAILSGDGTGAFDGLTSIVMAAEVIDLAVVDLQGDGLDDIVAIEAPGTVVAIVQSAAGVLATPQTLAGPMAGADLQALALDDFDGDGFLDIALADRSGAAWLISGPMSPNENLTPIALSSPSLVGPADIASVHWDGDFVADVALADLDGDQVVIVTSKEGEITAATAQAPRRLFSADIDGDGNADLVTANEGDRPDQSGTDPNNEDVSIVLSPATVPPADGFPQILSDRAIPANLTLRARSVSASSPDFAWVLTTDGQTVKARTGEGVLVAAAQLPAQAGALAMAYEDDASSASQGLMIHRFDAEISGFTFNLENPAVIEDFASSATFAYDPGALGFAGLAWDREEGELFVSAPGKGEIVRLSEAGTVLGTYPVTPTPGQMTWDPGRDLLVVTAPGRSDFRFYSREGVLQTSPPAAPVDLAERSVLFARDGLVALTYNDNNEFLAVGGNGFVLKVARNGSIREGGVFGPLSDPLALAHDPLLGKVIVLGNSGGWVELLPDDDSGFLTVSEMSIWRIWQINPEFSPTGLTLAQDGENVLISDRDEARLARFDRADGQFNGFQPVSLVDPGQMPYQSVTKKSQGNGVYLRDRLSLRDGETGERVPLPWTKHGDLSVKANGEVVLSLPNPSSVGTLDPVTRTESVIGLGPSDSTTGLAIDEASGELHRLNTRAGELSLQTYQFQGAASVSPAWLEYR